jgi:hypothetical protein
MHPLMLKMKKINLQIMTKNVENANGYFRKRSSGRYDQRLDR